MEHYCNTTSKYCGNGKFSKKISTSNTHLLSSSSLTLATDDIFLQSKLSCRTIVHVFQGHLAKKKKKKHMYTEYNVQRVLMN